MMLFMSLICLALACAGVALATKCDRLQAKCDQYERYIDRKAKFDALMRNTKL